MRLSHDGKRYHLAGHRSEAGFADVLKWQLTSRKAKWPIWIENQNHPPPPERVKDAAITVTWIGHSTVLVQTDNLNIITDPFLSVRASPFQWAGPRRVRPPGLTAETLPPIDIVLLSHNHYDHMDLPALSSIARRHRPVIVTPSGNGRYIRSAVGDVTIVERGWGEHADVGGARITITPALHWSKRSFFDANHALWGAFVVQTAAGPIYFGADTGYGDGRTFRDIHSQFGPPRLSLLPIGAYEPRWFMRPQHMNPDEAVEAHLALQSQTSFAIHHGTIQLTDEAIDAPVRALAEALALRSIDPGAFIVADVGRTLTFSGDSPHA